MAELAAVHAIVGGRVQGVWFRGFTEHYAAKFGLKGFVRNLPGGRSVEVFAEGEREQLEKLLERLRAGPRGASVENIEVNWVPYTGVYQDFEIVR